ncbi:hypothetical protein DITRI_Ditri16bG0065900 [Diplodiscus trichospermus]
MLTKENGERIGRCIEKLGHLQKNYEDMKNGGLEMIYRDHLRVGGRMKEGMRWFKEDDIRGMRGSQEEIKDKKIGGEESQEGDKKGKRK